MKETINLHFVTNYSDIETETKSKRNKYTHKNNLWNNITIDETKPADYYIIQNHPGNNKYIPEMFDKKDAGKYFKIESELLDLNEVNNWVSFLKSSKRGIMGITGISKKT